MNRRAPVATAERASNGDVILTLERQRSAFEVLTAAEARQLAAALLVAASEDATRTARQIGDAVETIQLGHQLFSNVQTIARKNGWIK